MDKIDRFFINLPPYLPQYFGFHVPYPCFQGDGGGGLLFHSILFKVAIMLDNLDPPPPPQKKKKRIPEGENDAFWPCGFIIDFARGMGAGGRCCSKIVDQTRKYMTLLQPSVTSEDCQNDF